MAAARGQPTGSRLCRRHRNGDKITAAEPHSAAGPLKKPTPPLLTMAEPVSAGRCKKCRQAQAVLVKRPGNPYAN